MTFLHLVTPIALLVQFALPFCVFLIGPMKSFLLLVTHTEASESQIALCVSSGS